MTCHRCGGDLPGDEVRGFCPTCGAPQLRVIGDGAETDRAGETTEALPPPKPPMIEWKIALRCGALVAVVTALAVAAASSVPYMGLPSLVLLFGASFVAVGMYRRQAPKAKMNPGIGAKIGLSTGLLLTAGLAVTLTLLLLAARYRAHSMAGFDAQWTAQIAQLVERTKATSPVPPEAERAMTTPEFRAGSMLTGMAVMAGFLLAISTGSGAFAGSITMKDETKR